MLSLYEILKASKTGIAPDKWTALAGMNWSGADSGHEVKELTGIPPLSFTADGTPLLDYLISGNMSQSGTPAPDNPIQPSETGERTGNLVFVSVDNETHFSNYNQYTISDGTITVTGRMLIGFKVKITPDTTYTVSAVYRAGVLMRVRQYTEIPNDWINGFINQPVNTNLASATFTTSSEAEWILVTFYSENVGGTINSIMLNVGSETLSYEPYGVKIPISSAGTTTNVYLGEVQTTRRVKKLVLTGEENWRLGTHTIERTVCYISIDEPISTIAGYCTHMECKIQYSSTEFNRVVLAANPSYIYISLETSLLSDATLGAFKSYLAQQYANGTPVTIWYVLATPETAVVNEPLRKIGDYADTLSMEQAGVQIPTNRGNTVIDVLTELKPSEMYIKYQE